MFKRIVSVFLVVATMFLLSACGGVSAISNNGVINKINLKNFETIDFAENENVEALNRYDLDQCFDIDIEYKGLPDIVLGNINPAVDVIQQSGWGYLFEDDIMTKEEFCNVYRPYVIYICKLRLKNKCYIDEKSGFYVKLAKFNDSKGEIYYGEPINIANKGTVEVEMHLFSQSARTGDDAWKDYKQLVEIGEKDETYFKQHFFPYKGKVDSFAKFGKNFSPIDFSKIVGVIYK